MARWTATQRRWLSLGVVATCSTGLNCYAGKAMSGSTKCSVELSTVLKRLSLRRECQQLNEGRVST